MKKKCPICSTVFKARSIRSHYCSIPCRAKGLRTWDTDELKRLYWEEGKTTCDIARMFGKSASTIAYVFRRRGIGFRPKKDRTKGMKHWAWKDKRLTEAGYVIIFKPEHHRAYKSGRVLEHIVIWEDNHKQQLPEGFLIHHLNGVKDDNRPENLVAMKKGTHIHMAEPFKEKIHLLEIENAKLKLELQKREVVEWR